MTTQDTHAPLVAPDWPMPRGFVWIWLLIIGFAWWTSAAESAEPTRAGAWATVAATLARFVAAGVETGFYCVAWRSVGLQLRASWFFTWVVTLSLFDLVAASLAGIAQHHPAAAPWLVSLAGPGVSPARDAASGLEFAIGSLGLLSAARVGLTAWLQAHDVGARVRTALALVVIAWITTHLVLWWIIDLARGMSPLP